MSISKISGVLISNIDSISGVLKSNISKIGSIELPQEITCTELSLSYDNRDASASCGGDIRIYYYDESSGILYNECGGELAPIGYYSNGVDIYDWNGERFDVVGRCR
jgi:hypothetical protein